MTQSKVIQHKRYKEEAWLTKTHDCVMEELDSLWDKADDELTPLEWNMIYTENEKFVKAASIDIAQYPQLMRRNAVER